MTVSISDLGVKGLGFRGVGFRVGNYGSTVSAEYLGCDFDIFLNVLLVFCPFSCGEAQEAPKIRWYPMSLLSTTSK